MCVLNGLDRFSLVGEVVDRLPAFASRAGYAKQAIRDALIERRQYIDEHGEDDPRILNWRWGSRSGPTRRRSSTEGDNV
jgi:xylulose-5-phosphate/fructose-6-phosphate phosphoketolase